MANISAIKLTIQYFEMKFSPAPILSKIIRETKTLKITDNTEVPTKRK